MNEAKEHTDRAEIKKNKNLATETNIIEDQPELTHDIGNFFSDFMVKHTARFIRFITSIPQKEAGKLLNWMQKNTLDNKNDSRPSLNVFVEEYPKDEDRDLPLASISRLQTKRVTEGQSSSSMSNPSLSISPASASTKDTTNNRVANQYQGVWAPPYDNLSFISLSTQENQKTNKKPANISNKTNSKEEENNSFNTQRNWR